MSITTMRGGFALPAALLALVVVAALVTGGMYASMEEDRASANVSHGHHAFMAAERGLEDVLGYKNRIYFEDSIGADINDVGAADTLGPVAITIGDVQAQYTVYVKRLHTRLFLVESEGRVTSGGRYAGSKRRLAEMMRITFTSVPMDRAVTTHSPLRTRGKSGIVGQDQVPAGWQDCTDMGLQKAVVAHTDDPKYIDVKGQIGLVGDPEIGIDATMDSLDFLEYGDMHLEDLMDVADIVLPPGTYTGMGPSATNGVCNKNVQLNWGDPVNPNGACHEYWPIIYSPGDLHLSTGVGQGILIVEGDLRVTGNAEFHGIVFVYGDVQASGTGNKLNGSVNILGGSDTTDIGVTGNGDTVINLSSCAIDRAHRYNERFSRPLPLAERKFVDISGLGLQ